MKFYDNRFDFLFNSDLGESEDNFVENVVDGSTAYDVGTGAFYIYYKGTWYSQNFEDSDSGSDSEPVI